MFKHVLNPLQSADATASPWTIVTGLVDQIDFTGTLRPDCDIRIFIQKWKPGNPAKGRPVFAVFGLPKSVVP